VRRAWNALLSATAYFTILPVGARARVAPNAEMLLALPLIGAVVGVTAGTAAWLLSFVAPHAFVVAAVFALSVILTGAIHLDGFFDSCDALFASVTPQRRLEILKDPRHGSFALAGFGVIVVFWLAALWSLPVAELPAALAFSAALARWSALLNAGFIADVPWWPQAVLGGVLLISAFMLGGRGVSAFLCAVAAALLGGQWAKRCLGGRLTGDTYGFLIVVSEVSALTLLG
jgi:adenosylcobinamide-GDP ribazoletransferase